MILFPLITSYEVLGGRLIPFKINALVVPLTILADTEMLLVVLLHNSNEVTSAKFFCQSKLAAEVGVSTIKPDESPSRLFGDASLLVEVLEGSNTDQLQSIELMKLDA